MRKLASVHNYICSFALFHVVKSKLNNLAISILCHANLYNNILTLLKKQPAFSYYYRYLLLTRTIYEGRNSD